MILIESEEGLLFRGPAVMNPSETWDHPRKRWVPFYPERQSVYEGWAHEISEERAEQLKVKNPSAEHYLYYDVGPWVPPFDPSNQPDPPDWAKKLIAERAAKRGSS